MNLVCSLIVATIAFSFSLPIAGQTPGDKIAKLQARVRALEAENAKLKEDLAKKALGSLGVPHGQIVTIEGEYDLKAPIKSIYDFKVTSVNGKDLPGDVHIYMKEHEWARAFPNLGKRGGLLRVKGFQCTQSVGDPFGRTGLAFQLVDVFMIIEVFEKK